MTCSQCGSDVTGRADFCPRCGSRLTRYDTSGDRPPAHAAGGTAYSFDARRWTVGDRIVGGTSLLVLVSLFLPWFSVSISSLQAASLGVTAGSASESGTDAHGWLWIVFVVALVMLLYLVVAAGYQVLPVNVPLRHEQLLLSAAGINLLLVFIAFLLKPGSGIAGLNVAWSFGAVLALVAAIAAMVPPLRTIRDQAAV